jgi:diguanylate cyclase (GGDEF)-like protein
VDFLVDSENRTKSLLVFVGFALIGVVGIIDFLTGYELAFSLFYVLPISLITWHTSRWFGLAGSLVSAVVWLGADLTSGHFYSHPLIPIWNTLIRLAFFVIITFLLSALRKAIQREGELARTDYLTGAVNSRFFYELAQMEMNRLRRYQHPFTIAYLDLDNFKIINEQSGHTIGDEVLRTVVSSAKTTLRRTDVVARLGGDEFALLLPETDQESARVVLPKIQGSLLEEMRQKHWPITFSIGVLTCRAVPPTADDMVRLADSLMYSVKQESKNGIKYSTYAG